MYRYKLHVKYTHSKWKNDRFLHLSIIFTVAKDREKPQILIITREIKDDRHDNDR